MGKHACEALKVGHCGWSIGSEQESGKVEIRKVTRVMFHIWALHVMFGVWIFS